MRRILPAVVALAVLLLTLFLGVTVAEWKVEADFARSVYAEVHRRPPHPFLQVLPAGQVDHVNDEGFRGDAITPAKAPHTFRLFTLGGSTTLGVTNAYEDSYPFLLQQLLRARHPGHIIEVENAGAAWYTTAHNVVSYDLRVRRFHPDAIVFFEAVNDLMRSFSPPWFGHGPFKHDYSHYLGPYARLNGPDVEFPTAPASWLDRWLVWRMAKRSIAREPTPFNQRDPDNVARLAASMKAVDDVEFRSVDSFREYYDTLIRRVTSDGSVFIAASQPSVYSVSVPEAQRPATYFGPIFCAENARYPSMTAMVRGMTLFNDTARSVASAEHVPFVDLAAAVPKTAEYFSDDVHLRASANRLVAERVADLIDQMRLIED
jgi:lysophospholipase L1-like esterase